MKYHRDRPHLILLIALGSVFVCGCSGNRGSEPIPPQTMAQVEPQLEPPPQLPPPIRELPPAAKPTVKVIDAGGDANKPKTLAEASLRAKQRKQRSNPEPIARINDDNLHEYAARAEVIVLESPPAVPPPSLEPDLDGAATEPAATAGSDGLRGEDYWRTRALELRMAWRRSVDRITELDLESAALRQQFYAEEDPYVRDSQVKPAWDRVLDRLDRLHDRAKRYEQELEVFIEEGRRAGALQGWLNQGWELEPTDEERERTDRFADHDSIDPSDSHQSIEPPMLREDGGS